MSVIVAASVLGASPWEAEPPYCVEKTGFPFMVFNGILMLQDSWFTHEDAEFKKLWRTGTMRRRNWITMALTAGLMLAASFSSFAGEWDRDDVGWFYKNTDGSYLSSGWYWVDGRSYYFNDQGYCLTSTTTPDGYKVDESGAWVQDGIVQTRETEAAVSGMRVIIPNGYDCLKDDETGMVAVKETNVDSERGILVMSVEEETISYLRANFGEESLKELSDLVVAEVAPEITFAQNLALVSSSNKTYSTGNWYYYLYKGTDENGAEVDFEFYTSFAGSEIRFVVIGLGAGREFNTNDEFMENCIRQ